MKKKIGFLFFLSFITLLFLPDQVGAQVMSNAVFNFAGTKWMVAMGGQYSEMDWPEAGIRSFDRQAQAEIGISLLPWCSLSGTVGYSQLDFRRINQDEIRFDPEYHWGGSINLGPFYFSPQKFAILFTVHGEWFNPYGVNGQTKYIDQTEWQEKKEYLLESIFSSAGINLVYKTGKFDFYAGPWFSRQDLSVKFRKILAGDGISYTTANSSDQYRTGIKMGWSVGAGVKLPGRYFINFQMRNNTLHEFFALISIAQIGTP